MASIIESFPRRPLALRTDPARRRARFLQLVGIIILAFPALYWGYQAARSGLLRADLQARGVRAAETLDAQGDCTSRHSRLSGTDAPIDCWLTVSYRLRPEEGGGLRSAPVHLEGAAPIFTPSAFYDPQDPGRVMLQPEMERAMTWSEWLGPLFLLALPGIALLVFLATLRRGLAKAARHPDPVVVPVEKVIRGTGKTIVHTRLPGATRPSATSFGAAETALQVPPPAGARADQQWVLALRGVKDRHYVLDSRLAWLDLADDERSRLLSAARGY